MAYTGQPQNVVIVDSETGEPVSPAAPVAVLAQSSGDWVTVSPSDVTPIRGTDVTSDLYVGTGGNLRFLTEKGQDVILKNVPGGSLVPTRCTKVFATNTTASDIVAVF